MTKLKVFIGILFLFLLGTASGSLGTMIYMHNFLSQPEVALNSERYPHRAQMQITLERRQPPMLGKLSRELNLNAEQQKAIALIMEDAHRQIQLVLKENKPKMDSIMNDSFIKINSHLDEQQQKKLTTIRLHMETRQKRMLDRPMDHRMNRHMRPDQQLPDDYK